MQYKRVLCLGLSVLAGHIFTGGAWADSVQRDGQTLYEANCAVCHGSDGEGAMPGIKNLVEKPAWINKSDKQLVKIIATGIQSNDSSVSMPPRGGNPELTDQQIDSIVQYLRKLAATN